VGAGSFGVVLRASHRQTGQTHAVKAVPKAKVRPEELWAEIDILKQLDHPHILRLYHTFEDDRTIYIASELCTGGMFFEILSKAGFVPERVALRLFKQIASVVSYLHCRKVCHRDLKPENFLALGKAQPASLRLKLIDFGTAKRFDQAPMVTKVCTPHYVAPEVLKKGSVAYTEKVDVWSSGVMLYLMLCGLLPFSHSEELGLLRLVKRGHFDFQPRAVWDLVSEQAKELISRMICTNVHDRCTAAEAFSHEWCHGPRCESRGDTMISQQLLGRMHRYMTNNRLKRVALHIIARQISDDSIERLRRVFLRIDKDNSGTLTVDEMRQAAAMLNLDEEEQQDMVEVMCSLDPTGSGAVAYTDFLAATLGRQQYLTESACRAAFLRLDLDADGVLSKSDLAALVVGAGGTSELRLSGRDREELESILEAADENGDEGISFEEFMKVMAEDGDAGSRDPSGPG